MPTEDAILEAILSSRCSSSIRKLPSGEILSGHTTWVFYSMLVRIFKHITLPFSRDPIPNPSVSFSSYPGQIVSADDYYTIGKDMVVMETSNNIFNAELYKHVVPQSLLSWQRTALANRLSTSGKEWATTFAIYNSGTYNNQYMILDYKKNETDLLWIVEQIPTLVVSGDMTSWLNTNSYWASYNIPYFPQIYNMSGYNEMKQKHGNDFSWEECPRARLFRRNETLVHDIESFKNLMRYNNYEHDPMENGNPMWAISSRGDLAKTNPKPSGGLDSKVTSNKLDGKTVAVCGPTWDQVPAFSWEDKFPTWPRFGQPNLWAFKWENMSPN